MKTLSQFLLAACALLLANCTAAVVKRIEHNPEIYNALSTKQKALVQNGKIEEGMSKQAVFLAWGRPSRAAQGAKQGKRYERWSYTAYDAVPSTSVGFGYGGGFGYYGRFGYYDPYFAYDSGVNYVPYEYKRAVFLNDRVTSWSVVK